MVIQYDFRKILHIDPDEEHFTCVGVNESHNPPPRCETQISIEDRKAASQILYEMNECPNFETTLKALPGLVSRTLCTETHRSNPERCQVGQIYTAWRDVISDHFILVKRESSKRAFERWRLWQVQKPLDKMKATMDIEKQRDVSLHSSKISPSSN